MQNRNVNCKKDAEQGGTKESLSPKGMFISEAHGGGGGGGTGTLNQLFSRKSST